jgi:hypothetical protein
MHEPERIELARWRWITLAVTVLGILLITLPWIPNKFKIMLAIPVYISFVFVYYKYLCLKKQHPTTSKHKK